MKFTNVPLVLEPQAPIASNGSEYNKLYLLGVVGAVIGFVTMGPGALITTLIGVVAGHIIKRDILKSKCMQLRKTVKFAIKVKVDYPKLVSALSKELSPLGMIVEIDKNGNPVISHNNVIYDVFYNEDDTFTIWWRKSIAKAFLSDDPIKLYRNCVVSMGIIGYNVQKISNDYLD